MSDSLAIVEIIKLRKELDTLQRKQVGYGFEMSAIKTRDDASEVISKAIQAMLDAYWAACDAEGRAIDPADIDAPEGFLDEAYRRAQTVEGVVNKRGITWAEARKLVDDDLLRQTTDD